MRKLWSCLLVALIGLTSINCESSYSCNVKSIATNAINQTVADIIDSSAVIYVKVEDEYRAFGSGAFVVRGDDVYVLTCSHLLRTVRHKLMKEDKEDEQQYAYDDVLVLELLTDSKGRVTAKEHEAEVIKASSDFKYDLAVLRLRSPKFKAPQSTTFEKSELPPKIGSKLYHVGTYHNPFHYRSLTDGIVSGTNRDFGEDDAILDQCTCTCQPGSSGGGVFLPTSGEYVGMMVRASDVGDNCSYYIPIRTIRKWAKAHGVEFLLDPRLEVPTVEALKSQPKSQNQNIKE